MMRAITALGVGALLAVSPAVRAQSATSPAPECRAEGFGRDVSQKMTDRLLDMGFVGFERMTVVDGCYRVVARNQTGDVVVLTFDSYGELIGLGLGSGGAAPKFAPPRDGIQPTD
jgi:hypothetical protein